jgi:hypothetical protein
MKMMLRIYLGVALALCLSGCIVQSIHPFFTEEAVIEMPNLNGMWMRILKESEGGQEKPWIFADNEIHTYGEKGGSGTLHATYFKIGELLFMDTTAAEPDHTRVSEWYEIHTAPVHIVCKVEMGKNRLLLTPINNDWLREALKKKVVSFPDPIREENDYTLFNISSEDWMRFLQKHGKNPEAFARKNTLEYIRR